MRLLRAAALALAVALPAAPAAAPAAAAPLRLGFDVYGGGLFLAHGDLDLDLADGRYAARLDARGGWLLALLTRFAYRAEAAGRLDPSGRVRPDAFRGERTLRRRHDVMRLDYGGIKDGVAVTAEPPQSAEDAAAVAPGFRPGTVDPLSAATGILAAAGTAAECGGRTPVFDGRRRYDILMAGGAADRLPPSHRSAFAGPARRCTVVLQPVAGFEADRGKGGFFAPDKTRQATVWFGRVEPAGRVLPIRVAVDTELGGILVHLVSAQPMPGGKPADQAALLKSPTSPRER